MAAHSSSAFSGAFSTGQTPSSSLASSISTFGNPFAAASSTVLASATSSQIGSKEDKNSMMAAFSDMGLELEASSSAAVAAASSAKALLAKKTEEKRQEEREEAQYRARRQARLAAKEQQKRNVPVSALMQAIDAFAGEVSQSDSFSSTLGRKSAASSSSSAGAFSAGSRRGRAKQEKVNATKDRSGKSVRDVKRHQRRETYRNI